MLALFCFVFLYTNIFLRCMATDSSLFFLLGGGGGSSLLQPTVELYYRFLAKSLKLISNSSRNLVCSFSFLFAYLRYKCSLIHFFIYFYLIVTSTLRNLENSPSPIKSLPDSRRNDSLPCRLHPQP